MGTIFYAYRTYASCWLAHIAMPKPYSEYTKQLIVYHHRQGLKPGDILQILQEEGIMASRRGIAKFFAKCIESGPVARKPRSGRPSKANSSHVNTQPGIGHHWWCN